MSESQSTSTVTFLVLRQVSRIEGSSEVYAIRTAAPIICQLHEQFLCVDWKSIVLFPAGTLLVGMVSMLRTWPTFQ